MLMEHLVFVPAGASIPPLKCHFHGNGRGLAERLVDHAVALGELEQGGALLGGDGAFDIEDQTDVLEAHGSFAVDAQGAAEIQIAFGADPAVRAICPKMRLRLS
jgi:hypothetical protein